MSREVFRAVREGVSDPVVRAGLMADLCRINTLFMIMQAGSGHIGSSFSSTDIITGDTVTFANTSATFDTKNVGTGKTVTVAGLSISGTDAGNYNLSNATATTTADITAAPTPRPSPSDPVTPPKPIIPAGKTEAETDNNSSGNNGSTGNTYTVIKNNDRKILDLCTPTNLEACACDTQPTQPIEGIAICYQPYKRASNDERPKTNTNTKTNKLIKS